MDRVVLPTIDMDEVKAYGRIDVVGSEFAISDSLNEFRLPTHPFRVGVGIVALCLEGGVPIRINQRDFVIEGNQLLILLPEDIVRYEAQHVEAKGLFIAVSSRLFDEVLPRIADILPLFFYIREHPFISMTGEEVARFKAFHAYLWSRVRQSGVPYQKEIIRSLLQVLSFDMQGILTDRTEVKQPASRQNEIFSAFLKLLALHFKRERSLAFYAQRLFITSKYLSTVVKQVSHKTATDWIDDYVIAEAKTLLRSSGCTIQEISNELSFPNQSFFGKFFKRKTGYTPRSYRAM